MKLVSVTIAKNESDIIELFLRHNATFLDKIVIIDNGSSDSTIDTVHTLAKEGLPIDLYHYQSVGHDQHLAIRKYSKLYAQRGFDWILPMDSDEFIVCASGDLRDDLGEPLKCKIRQIPKIPWRTYVPTPDDDQLEKNTLKRITHRLETEIRQFHKIVVPGRLLTSGPWNIRMGNHALRKGNNDFKIYPSYELTGVAYAHFPVRSVKQIKSKVLSGWPATLAKKNYGHKEAFHWKELYDKFRETPDVGYELLTEMALNYTGQPASGIIPNLVKDPVCTVNELATSSLEYEIDPISFALGTSEKIAEELGKLKRRRSGTNWSNYFARIVLDIKRKLKRIS